MDYNFAVGNITRDIYRAQPQYPSWNLTNCCGFEVQNTTKALKSVTGPDNTSYLSPLCSRTLPFGIYRRYILSPTLISKLKFDTLLWAWDATVKGLAHTFLLNPKSSRTLPLWILQDIFIELTTKYRSWTLTPYYGLEVHNFTQALKSVKGPGNIFDLDRKWEPLPNFAVDIWHLAVFVCSV